MTTHDGTGDPRPWVSRAVQWLPGLVAVVASVGVILLIVTGHSDQITPVAALGAAAITGGTLQVTINIRR